jgi:hypothetical protein
MKNNTNPRRQPFPHKPRAAFTAAEILVVTFVASLLIMVLFSVSRSNLNTMSWGQKHMDFNYKIQYMMKQFYTDVKRVNPAISFGKYGDLYLSGERTGEVFPQIVKIERKADNSGEKIHLPLTTIYDDTKMRMITYDYDKKTKVLIRKDTDTKQAEVLAYNVHDLTFSKSDDDPKSIKLTCRIEDDKRAGVFEDIDFTVRLESELVSIQVKTI